MPNILYTGEEKKRFTWVWLPCRKILPENGKIFKNFKSEIRISKFETNSNDKNSNEKNKEKILRIGLLLFWILNI
jgi:hypothetical protein